MCLRKLLEIIASCGNKPEPQSKNLFDINLLKGKPGITVEGNTFSGTAQAFADTGGFELKQIVPLGWKVLVTFKAYPDPVQNRGGLNVCMVTDVDTEEMIDYVYAKTSETVFSKEKTAWNHGFKKIILERYNAASADYFWHISDLVVKIIQDIVAITYMNGDVVCATETLEKGTDGNGPSSNPTKQSTAQYTYTFAGWSTDSSATTADPNALKNVTSDRTVYAVYTETVRTYTITFVRAAEDGGGTLQTLNNVAYGTIPVYTGETPTTTKTGEWRFNGWSPAISAVTGDQTYTAVFADASSQTRKMINRAITSVADETLSVIGNYAFCYCYNLQTISFPNARIIEEYAFQNCYKLMDANFSLVTSVGYHAFYYCTSLTTASFPIAETIGEAAFQGCYSLTTTSFPLVTSIGRSALSGCYQLTNVSFPSATHIGSCAFRSCSSITTIYFPNVQSINNSAFYDCYRLESVSFPEAVFIGNNVFQNCSALTAATFPALMQIGGSAFSNCKNMSALILGYESGVVSLGSSNAFTSNPTMIFVPDNLVNDYKNANNWSYFASRIKEMSEL